MSELKPLFELEGRPVMRGQELHIAPSYHWRAGARAKVERFHNDEEVQLRSDNGAVPTVPVRALSWRAHPDTVAMEQMAEAGLGRASPRDLAVWKAARAQPAQAVPLLSDEEMEAAIRPFYRDSYSASMAMLNNISEYLAVEQAVRAKMGVAVPWTVCADTLPPKNTEVLIKFRDTPLPSTGQYTASPFDNDGWCYPKENDPEEVGPVTHWMPLPPPPGIVGKEGA